jgi:WD40 repeat protein
MTGVTCCAYSPTGRFIVSGSAYDENSIKLW